MIVVPVGQGEVDYREFISALSEIGYQGALAYEMCSPLVGGGGEENLDRSARASLEHVQSLIAEQQPILS
jgi:L-ribulose-5-phosphate 3-epimerase